MSIYQVYSCFLGDYATNAYLIVSGTQALAIDAPPGAWEYYHQLGQKLGVNLHYLLLTHSHFDHIADAAKIQLQGIKVGIHPLDRGNCVKPGSDRLPLMMPVGPFTPDFLFDSTDLVLDSFHIKVIPTPGHTPGGVCFIIGNYLFSGDTLFKEAIGNISFPTAEAAKMKESLVLLKNLKENYIVYPGHGPKTELDKERKFLHNMIENIG
jgi:glyoxylase-like metal-dependent hydrolase (beta-lactamase superfamily II)